MATHPIVFWHPNQSTGLTLEATLYGVGGYEVDFQLVEDPVGGRYYVANDTITTYDLDVGTWDYAIRYNGRVLAAGLMDWSGIGATFTTLSYCTDAIFPPIADVEIPKGRTITLQHTSDGLIGGNAEALQVGESKIYAVDFRKDMPSSGRFASVEELAIQTGTAGGVTFDSTDTATYKTQVRIKPTAVTAGTYVVRVKVIYDTGEAAEGDVTFMVVD